MTILAHLKEMWGRAKARLASYTLVFLLAATASAANTEISNVILLVDEGGRSSFTVTNQSQSVTTYELTAYDWRVRNGKDAYEQTSEFVAIPPAFSLNPGASRVVRVGFRDPRPQPIERTFRLSVREVPDETGADGVSFAFEHMLAVYVEPAGGREPAQLAWSMQQLDAQWFVRVENNGNSRAVLERVSLDGDPIDLSSTRTILPRTWRQYNLPQSIAASAEVLRFDLKDGTSGQVTLR